MSESTVPVAQNPDNGEPILDNYLAAATQIDIISAQAERLRMQTFGQEQVAGLEVLRQEQARMYGAFVRAQMDMLPVEALVAQRDTVARQLEEIVEAQRRLLSMTTHELVDELVGDIKQMTGEPTDASYIAGAALEAYHALEHEAAAITATMRKLARAATLAVADVNPTLIRPEERQRIRDEAAQERRAPSRVGADVSEGSTVPVASAAEADKPHTPEKYARRIEAVASVLASEPGKAWTYAQLAEAAYGHAVDRAGLVTVGAILQGALKAPDSRLERMLAAQKLKLVRLTVPNPNRSPKAPKTLVAYSAVPIEQPNIPAGE